MKIKNAKKTGFTFIELIFAITILGVLLSMAMVIVVGMLRFYVYSSFLRQNQENGRNTLDLIVKEIKFGKLLLPTSTITSTTSLCVRDNANGRMLYYSLDSANKELDRSVYSFNQINPPTTCDLSSNNVRLVAGPTKMNLDNMKIYKFDVQKTEGALGGNGVANAVTIALGFLTGNSVDNTNCAINDIYCNSQVFNTAVELRQIN